MSDDAQARYSEQAALYGHQLHAFLESFEEEQTFADRVEYWRQRLSCMVGRHRPFDWFGDDFPCLFCGARRTIRRRLGAYIASASAGIALALAIYLPLILWR